MSKLDNPVLKMLYWRVRKLGIEEVIQVLGAVASIEDRVFTLTDVVNLLSKDIIESRQKRRSIGTLLQNLAELGYLSKPSERKWVKNAPTFSHYLNQFILELSSLEKSFHIQHQHEKEKIVKVLEKPHRLSR
ncbi:MAG: hypothetical protein QW718_07865 [Nitrososphaerota archaeon]